MADGAAEDEHTHLSVKGGDIWVSHERFGALVQVMDPVAFANHNLENGSFTMKKELMTAEINTVSVPKPSEILRAHHMYPS